MQIRVVDSKNVIVFVPLLSGHVIRCMRSGRVRILNANQRETLWLINQELIGVGSSNLVARLGTWPAVHSNCSKSKGKKSRSQSHVTCQQTKRYNSAVYGINFINNRFCACAVQILLTVAANATKCSSVEVQYGKSTSTRTTAIRHFRATLTERVISRKLVYGPIYGNSRKLLQIVISMTRKF